MRAVIRGLAYAWAAPYTLLGLLLLPLAAGRSGSVRRVDGVIEMRGTALRFLLTRCAPIHGGADAVTLGHVVIGRDLASLDATRDHERIHVRQYERWGPFFLPAYVLSSLLAMARGRDPYRDNHFEREAFARAPTNG